MLWAKAVAPALDDYVKSMKEKNLPGGEALSFCLNYLKTHPYRQQSRITGNAVGFCNGSRDNSLVSQPYR